MVQKDKWSPTDGLSFEQGALDAIKDMTNSLVKAGPGAGKTELLAQKANYLLTTNLCPSPQKILAISFKKDAAVNLAERVSKRVPKNKVSQFYSITFDAFAKGLLDRFLYGLPDVWRPSDDYEVEVFPLNGLTKACHENRVYLSRIPQKQQKESELVESSLNDLTGINFDIWQTMLHGNDIGKSYLTFRMITRLVIFLLENNPHVVDSIRKTYKMVFLDEFQDTTVLQYELISVLFKETKNIITAVGDDRQKIMSWAGAHPDAFSTFENEFNANQHALYINRRSDAKIQRLLQELSDYAQGNLLKMSATKVQSEAMVQAKTFGSSDEETQDIIEMIQRLLTEGKNMGELCILVKQRASNYVEQVKLLFNEAAINIRDEACFQDLLKEKITVLILNSLKAAIDKSDSDAWMTVLNFLHTFSDSKSYFDAKNEEKMVIRTKKFLKHISGKLNRVITMDDLSDVFQDIVTFYGIDNIRVQFVEYSNRGYFDMWVENLCKKLHSYYKTTEDWREAILHLEGKNCIPVMTIHKSKGLEFNTVFLVGLDDESFWSFKDSPEETTAILFVAISRAKKNFIATFTSNRLGKQCERQLISAYYDVFRQSGVVEFL